VGGDTINSVIEVFRRAAQLDDQAAHSDDELLTAFILRKDDAAFEALVGATQPAFVFYSGNTNLENEADTVFAHIN
jgi:hypothetical protein